jgi:hypothetical protein
MGINYSLVGIVLVFFCNSFVYWIDLGGGQVPMKIARVRFDGKFPENVIVNNLLQPNYIVYNLDLHCIFWSDVGIQKVNQFSNQFINFIFTSEDFLSLYGFW